MVKHYYLGDSLRSLSFRKEKGLEETVDLVSDNVAYFDSS